MNPFHAGSHFALQILPVGLDLVYVVVVILVGPLVALFFIRSRRAFTAGLLAVLMGGSFVYGFANHFLIAGPDNVLLVTGQPWTVAFVSSAVALGFLEVAAAAIAATVFWAARTPSGPAAQRT